MIFDHIFRPDLYRIVGNAVSPNTNLTRIIATPPLELRFTGGSEDLYTYQQLALPATGVVQDRPQFSNIDNGIGLFTSRYVLSLFRNMDPVSHAAFDTSRYTRDIHFQ